MFVLHAHVEVENSNDDLKDSFSEELEQVFDQSPKHHVKILRGNFSANPVTGYVNRQLRMRVYMRIVMIMVVRKVNFATVKNGIVKGTMFSH